MNDRYVLSVKQTNKQTAMRPCQIVVAAEIALEQKQPI
jgi:hypothetical protein